MESARLQLEPLVAAHADELFGGLTDARLYTYTPDQPPLFRAPPPPPVLPPTPPPTPPPRRGRCPHAPPASRRANLRPATATEASSGSTGWSASAPARALSATSRPPSTPTAAPPSPT